MRIETPSESAAAARDAVSEHAAKVQSATTIAANAVEATVEAAPHLAEQLSDVVDLTDGASMLGPALSMIGHLSSDDGLSTTAWGHVRDATLRTTVDVSVDAGMAATLRSASSSARGAGLASAGLAAADVFTDDATAAGVAVDMARSVDPGTQIAASAYGLVDGAAILMNTVTGNVDVAIAQSEQMQVNAINGEYGSAAQGLSIATGVLTGDRVTRSAVTDRGAEQGDRGVMPALGNYIGDTWADVAGHNLPSDGRYVDPDEHERSLRFRSIFGL